MGITSVEGKVSNNGHVESVQFMVDSGATYTLLPHQVWTALGLQPKRRLSCTLADGTKVQRDVSECRIELPQGDGHTPVILGHPGDQGFLGAVTLEILGLVLNPFNCTVHPMQLLLG